MGNEFDELKDKMKEVKNNLENTGEETKGAVLYFYYIASFLVPLFGLVMFFLKNLTCQRTVFTLQLQVLFLVSSFD